MLRPNAPSMKVCMMGPRAVGKTTVITAIANESKNSIARSNLVLKALGDTDVLLDDRYKQLTAVFDRGGDEFSMEVANAGLQATSVESSFEFGMGVVGKNESVQIEIVDFPGEYIQKEPKRTKEFISESQAILIAIDTPHLMENDGQFCEAKNRIGDITNFFSEVLPTITDEKLVLLIPLKCEKYWRENRMQEVLERVKQAYQVLIDMLHESGKICCLVNPILTLGGVVFDRFETDNTGRILLEKDGTPSRTHYAFTGRDAEYSPLFCAQPLYSMLAFVASQYRRDSRKGSIIKKTLNALYNLFGADNMFFEEVEKMKNSRIADNKEHGFETLCGGYLFN